MSKRKIIVLFLIAVVLISGCRGEKKRSDSLFQVSTINALMEGVYDGDVSIKELKKRGDFGIGTFNSLDGEMLAIGGEFYQIKSDGSVNLALDSMFSPFSVVTFFEADISLPIAGPLNYDEFTELLNLVLPTSNIPYAIKFEGEFDYVKARSVPAQDRPYPKLTEVVKSQPVFESRNIEGTVVGFRIPAYMQGLNVSGYHFHFISKDKQFGGHLLACAINQGNLEVDPTHEFNLHLLSSGDFYQSNIDALPQENIHKVEKGK